MDENELLRAVALGTAESIRQAKQRAEQELLRTRDALESKAAELEASLAAMRATLEATPDGILVIGDDDRVVVANARFAHMWRIPLDALLVHCSSIVG